MKFRFLSALILVASTLAVGTLGAESLAVTGKAGGPVVAVISGESGLIRVSHAGTVVREEAVTGAFTAAVVLAGPEDIVTWSGTPSQVIEGGADPVAVARKALEGQKEGQTEGTGLLINASGAVEVLWSPSAAEYDGESAATAEE